MNYNLPKDFSINEDGVVFYKEDCISNGFVTVLHHTVIRKQSGQEVISVELCFHVAGEEYMKKYSVEQLEKTKFLDVPILYLEHPRTQNVELFKQIIRFQMSQIKPTIIYEVNQLGYSVINGKQVYCFGNKILGASDINMCVAEDIKDFELQYTHVNAQALAYGLNKFLSLNPAVTLAMMAYLVLGLSRQCFADAGVPIHFVLFIAGQNQSFKTTLSCLYFNIYNRHDDVEKHLYNFSSTKSRLIQVLDKIKDAPIVFDDLNKSDSSTIMRKQEEMVSSLIQMAANNVGKQTVNDSYKIAGQLVFCGEYTLKNMSTNNRTFLLRFSKDMFDKQKIKELQDYADIIPQFAEEYVSWLLENYSDVTQRIGRRFEQFLVELSKNDDNQNRLTVSANILVISFELLMSFCEYKGWTYLLSYANDFPLYVQNLVCNQIEELRLEGEKEMDICCELFFALYDSVYEDFPEKKPTEHFDPPIYYNRSKDFLYIKGEVAADILHKRIGKVIKYPQIFNEFHKLGFLDVDKTKDNLRTKQPGKSKKRYYCIRYQEWKSYVKEMLEEENYESIK